VSDPRRFYTETIPAQFNAALEQQERESEEGRRRHADMQAVSATICAEVLGAGGGRFYLNIENGRMRADPRAVHPPFLTLRQERSSFDRLAADAGDSMLALLGGLSGLAGEMRLTRTRIENLSAVRGLVRFEVAGPRGFALLTHFGPDPVPELPAASILVDEAVYADLRGGRLDPTQAFLDGKIRVEGDVQLTLQLALAALAPD
jgi:hypothetical protein